VHELSAEWGKYAAFWVGTTLLTESDDGPHAFERHDVVRR